MQASLEMTIHLPIHSHPRKPTGPAGISVATCRALRADFGVGHNFQETSQTSIIIRKNWRDTLSKLSEGNSQQTDDENGE